MNLESIAIGHVELRKSVIRPPLLGLDTYGVRSVFGANSCTVEEEPNGGCLFSLPLTEGVHQLLKLGRALDLEEDFVVVVGDLDVQVLRGSCGFLLGRHVGMVERGDLGSECQSQRRIANCEATRGADWRRR